MDSSYKLQSGYKLYSPNKNENLHMAKAPCSCSDSPAWSQCTANLTCTNSLGFLVPPVASLEHSCSRKQNSSECQPLLDLQVLSMQQTCIWMQSGQSCSQNEF